MTWQTGDGEHEGYVAFEVPGGQLSGGPGGGGVIVDIGKPTEHVVPDREVVGWRTACSCGWRGQRWARVTDPAQTDPAANKVYLAADEMAFAPPAVENAGHDEWLRHIKPHVRVAAVRDAAADVDRAQDTLDDAVHAARFAGASWADIGAAAGMTKQSAHERWAAAAAGNGELTHA